MLCAVMHRGCFAIASVRDVIFVSKFDIKILIEFEKSKFMPKVQGPGNEWVLQRYYAADFEKFQKTTEGKGNPSKQNLLPKFDGSPRRDPQIVPLPYISNQGFRGGGAD